MRTAFITHPNCRKHKMIDEHPECPARLDAISDRLLASGIDISLEHKSAPKASLEQIALVHEQTFIDEVLAKIPAEGLQELDGDTWLCPDSFKAIERAAGAGILAVDEVLAKHIDAAFCSVRPPGHHANQDTASGFCVFNNLAIAVAYAKTKGVQRIAVVDFDVHHGNGTQDIFRDDHSVLFCSLFQYPFYPNTAIENHQTLINSPLDAGCDGQDLRALVEQQWLPAIEAFAPQLIFISAGFDGHLEDDMGGLKFVEQDYHWFTEQMVMVSQRLDCNGIISFLEGGYDLSSLGRSAVAHIKALIQG
ncbi:histone deacetylase family protein [Pseudoalteromonas sp. T1lg65]|uniref:histone deacetylase family protein n=1 Tax=Pseudoalteromonas sp. T1lg65 TaxID=2077101 RepID=UPI003F79FECD